MTKMTRKLLLSIITVVLTVVALGTTTFAWFTLTNTAQIQEFEVDIIADSGIEIAIGALGADLNSLEWKTIITPEDIYEFFGGVGADIEDLQFLNHVTTPDGINFYTLGTTTEGASVSGGYIELPVHFRSNSADAITWTQAAISGEAADWIVDTAFVDALGTSRTAGSIISVNPADAMRVAIQGTVGGDSNHVVAYENSATGTNVRLGSGDNFGTNVYVDPADTTVPPVEHATAAPTYIASSPTAYANGSYNYFANKNSNEVPLWGIEAVTTVATELSINGQTVTELGSGTDAGLTQTYYGNIVIRVWLEGWDANSFDAQLARRISVRFEFLGVEAV